MTEAEVLEAFVRAVPFDNWLRHSLPCLQIQVAIYCQFPANRRLLPAMTMMTERLGSDSFLEKLSGTPGDTGLKHLVLLHSDFTEQGEDLFISLGYIDYSTKVYIKQKGTMFK